MSQDQTIEQRIEQALFAEPPEKVEPVESEPVVEDQSDDVQVQATESDQDLERASEDEEQPQVEEVEAYQSISDIAEALEVPFEDFAANTKVKVKIYGQEREVPLAEAIAGYQKGEGFDQKKGELARERQEFEQIREKEQERIKSELATVEHLSAVAENQLLQEYNSIDWQKLAAEDPGNAAYHQQQYQQRMAQIQQAKQAVQDQMGTQYQQALNEGYKKTLQAIPEWNDDQVRMKEQADLRRMLSEAGFTDREIGNVVDHRTVLLMRELMQLRQAKERVAKPDKVTKVLSQKTKILKAGPRKSETQKKGDRVTQLRSKLKKTGKPADAVALLMERM